MEETICLKISFSNSFIVCILVAVNLSIPESWRSQDSAGAARKLESKPAVGRFNMSKNFTAGALEQVALRGYWASLTGNIQNHVDTILCHVLWADPAWAGSLGQVTTVVPSSPSQCEPECLTPLG